MFGAITIYYTANNFDHWWSTAEDDNAKDDIYAISDSATVFFMNGDGFIIGTKDVQDPNTAIIRNMIPEPFKIQCNISLQKIRTTDTTISMDVERFG